MIPPGTPPMTHPELVTRILNEDTPDLCPVCGHATLYRFGATVLHDDGVVSLSPTSACGSTDCDDGG